MSAPFSIALYFFLSFIYAVSYGYLLAGPGLLAYEEVGFHHLEGELDPLKVQDSPPKGSSMNCDVDNSHNNADI